MPVGRWSIMSDCRVSTVMPNIGPASNDSGSMVAMLELISSSDAISRSRSSWSQFLRSTSSAVFKPMTFKPKVEQE